MQVLSHHSAALPFSTGKHITTAAKLTPAESKLLGTVKGKIDELNTLAERCAAPRMGSPHALDAEIHAAGVALSEAPSPEAAEKLHSLITRKRDAEFSAGDISAAIRPAVHRLIDSLSPIGLRILDDAEAAFLAEAEAHKKATAGQTTFAATTENFSARIEATSAAFSEKRRWIREENAAAHFIMLELGIES